MPADLRNHLRIGGLILTAVFVTSAYSQRLNREVPGGIVLLPGYQYQQLQGIDSWVGRIQKKDLIINHDIGAMAGTVVTPKVKGQYFHFTEERVPGQVMWWGLFVPGHRPNQRGKSSPSIDRKWPKELRVSFSCNSNFFATVHSDQDIDEILRMLRTFRCERLYQQSH